MHCFGTYFTHVQTCDNVLVQSATQCTASVHTLYMSKLQTCDNVRVQSATQCTASVHTLHIFQFWNSGVKLEGGVGLGGDDNIP